MEVENEGRWLVRELRRWAKSARVVRFPAEEKRARVSAECSFLLRVVNS